MGLEIHKLFLEISDDLTQCIQIMSMHRQHFWLHGRTFEELVWFYVAFEA